MPTVSAVHASSRRPSRYPSNQVRSSGPSLPGLLTASLLPIKFVLNPKAGNVDSLETSQQGSPESYNIRDPASLQNGKERGVQNHEEYFQATVRRGFGWLSRIALFANQSMGRSFSLQNRRHLRRNLSGFRSRLLRHRQRLRSALRRTS